MTIKESQAYIKFKDSQFVRYIKERIDKIFLLTTSIIFIKELLFLFTLRRPEAASINFFDGLFVLPDFISALLMVLMLMSISLIFKGKARFVSCYIINLIVSLGILIDLWYYRANYSFLSIRHIVYPDTFNPLGNSIFNPKFIDIFLFVDLIILAIVFIKNIKLVKYNAKRSIALALILFISSGLYLNYRHIKIDNEGTLRGQLFRNCWVPFQTMMNTSFIGYQGFDIYRYFESSQKEELTNDEEDRVNKWLEYNKEDIEDNEYKGKYEGKNLIFIQVESLENNVIGQKVNGQEITPNLNKLLRNSLYFNNIYEQNNTGFSSDCDLMVNTGLLPKTDDSVAYSRPQLDVYSLAEMLGEKGYETISSRTEEGGNWNWAETHKGIYDFDKLIDLNRLEKDDMKSIYLSDASYFRQLAEKTKEFKEPYYSMMVTMTSHAPFSYINEAEKYLNLSDELNENYLGKYFQSVRYTDEQIGKFIDELDKSGELDNTVIAIYGDHTGVHKVYEDEIQTAPLEGDWWRKQDYEIPLIIYSKDTEPEVIETYGGQVDLYPTVGYLMGAERSEIPSSVLGRVLVNTERNAVVLKDGNIMGNIKDEAEKKHLEESVEISELMIKGDYFPK